MSKSHVPKQPKRIVSNKSNVEGILPYDSDNLYPQNMENLVKSSGMASSCVDLLAKFIRGKGYADNTFYKTKINNKGLTLDKLNRFTSLDEAKCGGSSWLIKYNGLLEIDEVFYIPFKHCRLAGVDENGYVSKIAVYDDWECQKEGKILKEKIQYYDIYNPDPEAIMSQIELVGAEAYHGQIYWTSNTGSIEYPLAVYDSVREDIATDSNLKKFRMNNVDTGFAPALIVEYAYEFSGEEEEQAEAENWRGFKGPDNVNKIIMIQNKNGNSEDRALRITPVQGNNNDKLYELTAKTVKDSIVESFSQPKVLLGVQSDGGITFSNDVLKDAFDYYNSVTYDARLQLEEKTKEIFTRFKKVINATGNYSIIPLSFGNTTNNA